MQPPAFAGLLLVAGKSESGQAAGVGILGLQLHRARKGISRGIAKMSQARELVCIGVRLSLQ